MLEGREGRDRGGGEEEKEGKEGTRRRAREEVLGATLGLKEDAWRGCVLDCHLLRACFSARFLPAASGTSSIDRVWTPELSPLSGFFLSGPGPPRQCRILAHVTCGPLASLFYYPLDLSLTCPQPDTQPPDGCLHFFILVSGSVGWGVWGWERMG